MANVIRNKTNLSGLASHHLMAIAQSCVRFGVNESELIKAVAEHQFGRVRIQVACAAIAYDMLQSLKTVVHAQEPSKESKLWSNMEGGHTYHEVPEFDINELMKL